MQNQTVDAYIRLLPDSDKIIFNERGNDNPAINKLVATNAAFQHIDSNDLKPGSTLLRGRKPAVKKRQQARVE